MGIPAQAGIQEAEKMDARLQSAGMTVIFD